MKSLQAGFIEGHPISQSLLSTVRVLGQYRGKQDLFRQQSPQLLETLEQTAVVQSTESSNRIEGVFAPHERIRQLVARKTTPRNRSEQEIAGYREVLNTVHVNHAQMPFRTGLVLQMHRDLYQFMPAEGGRWKSSDNEISEVTPDGTRLLRFRTVPAFLTPDAMNQLHERFTLLLDSGAVEPLLLVPAYVLDFLCIHPFLDGNGRMARLLTLLLLYKTGYDVGRYISLEQIVEKTRDGYYDALYRSSQGWHEGGHSLIPWWEYFLGVMLLGAYRELEQRVSLLATFPGAKGDAVRSAVRRLPQQFRFVDVERACPGVSRPTINRALAVMRKDGIIRCVKAGRDALWEKTG